MLIWQRSINAQTAPNLSVEQCTLSGRVFDRARSAAVRGATVELVEISKAIADRTSYPYVLFGAQLRPPNPVLVTTSLNDGAFCFRAVPSGQFLIEARKEGFLTSSYGATNYFQLGTIVAVGSKPVQDIVIPVDPLISVAGRVVDNDGESVADANVVAIKHAWYRGRRVFMPVQGTQSYNTGEYRIGKLAPGTYLVYMQPIPFGQATLAAAPGEGVVRTYFRSAPGPFNAAQINVRAGEDARGIDIRALSGKSYHVRGRLQVSTNNWSGISARLLVRDEEPMGLAFGGGIVGADGTFDFPNVSPGLYTLRIQSSSGAASVPIEVRDADISIDVPIINNATIRGAAIFEPTIAYNPADAPRIVLTSSDMVIGPSYQLSINADGAIATTGITPGKYALDIATPSGTFVASIKTEGVILKGRELDVTRGGAVDFKIAIKNAAPKLIGSVEQAPISPAYILLIADPSTISGPVLRVGTTNSNGEFSFGDVAPGKYRIAATEAIDVRLFQSHHLLKSMGDIGTAIELRPGETRSIQLSLANRYAVEQAFTRASAVE